MCQELFYGYSMNKIGKKKNTSFTPLIFPWGQGENKILKSVTEAVEENSVIGKNKVGEVYKVCNLNKLVT